MEMQNIARWYLPEDVSTILTAIVKEELRLIRAPGMMKSSALLEKVPSRHATDPGREVDWRREHCDRRIVRMAMLHK